MNRTVLDIVVRSNASSALEEALAELGGRPELKHIIARDIEAALRRDGVALAPKALADVVGRNTGPQTPEERLVANALALIEKTPPLSLAEAAGPAWFDELYEHLVAGTEGLRAHPRRHATAVEILGIPTLPPTVESIRKRIANAGHLEAHPLMDVLFVSDIMFDSRPFGGFDGLMETVLRHVLVRELGLPALRFVPYSALRLDWELGIGPHNHLFAYGEAAVLGPYGVDSTPSLRESLTCMRLGLDELETVVAHVRKHDADLLDAIEADWRLNQRQKELLRRLVAQPDRVIDARTYEFEFETAMSTAHTDLASLARMGLLAVEPVGRKQTYRLRPAALGDTSC